MTKWKVGDRAMVEIVEPPTIHNHAGVKSPHFGVVHLYADILQPLPPDPHQALKDAVIEAAKGYMKEGADVALYQELRKAVDALTAAQTQTTPKPDLVMTLFETVMAGASPGKNICADVFHPYNRSCLQNLPACHCRRHIARGLAAVEAARGAK